MQYIYARWGKERSRPSSGEQQVDDDPNAAKKGEVSKGINQKEQFSAEQ